MSMTSTLPKGLKVAFINARSLNNEKLDLLKIHFSNFDAVGVCETWFDETQEDSELKWADKVLYRHDRIERCGGVALYMKKEFANYTTVVDAGMSMSGDLELLSIVVARPDCRKNVCLSLQFFKHIGT